MERITEIDFKKSLPSSPWHEIALGPNVSLDISKDFHSNFFKWEQLIPKID